MQQEFADRPQELQSFIQSKSPTGSISSDAQKIIDAAADAISGRSDEHGRDYELGTSENYERFSKVVDDVFSGRISYTTTTVIGKTPELLRQYGAKNRIITITPDTMYKIAYPKGYLEFLKGIGESTREQGHNLGLPALKHLPEQIADPVAILKSSSELDSLIVLTAWEDKHRNPIIIPLHINKRGAIERETRVTSAYGKRSIDVLLGENDSNVLWTKNNEDIHQLLSDGHQLPTAMAEDVFGNSLSHDDQNVNNESPPKSDTEASTFDTDIPMRHIDGSVRTYAEYKAEQEAAQAAEAESAHQNEQQDFTPAPGTDKSPMDNKDVAEVVNADGNKRADDIELQHSQRLKVNHNTQKRTRLKGRLCACLWFVILTRREPCASSAPQTYHKFIPFRLNRARPCALWLRIQCCSRIFRVCLTMHAKIVETEQYDFV